MRPGPHFAFGPDPVNASGSVCFLSHHTRSGLVQQVAGHSFRLVDQGGGQPSRMSQKTHGQRTLLFWVIKSPRVITAEITSLNNAEVWLLLLPFLSSEAGKPRSSSQLLLLGGPCGRAAPTSSRKTCWTSLGTWQGAGLGSRSKTLSYCWSVKKQFVI
uniref:Uncharacterized protein n=1 Tax=Falco tinnunculus TaxID=100819 RepID=A0A8C4UJM0_FALTI